jgi:PKD repeat protein
MKLYRSRIIAAALLGIGICASGAWGTTLRIVSYNIDCEDEGSDNNLTGSTHSLPTVVQAIGLHHLGTNAQPVDVMSVEELNSTTLANFTTQLNNIYGAGTYAYDPTTDPNTGGGPDGLIYRTNTVQVVSARALRTGQTVLLGANGIYTAAHSPGGGVKGVTRAPMVYQLRPIGSGSSDDFYFYVSHARSTSDDSVGDARYAEAQEVRSDAKYNLPAGAHILYGGDWNLFNGSGENAYKCLTGQTTSDGINWSDGSAIWANTNQTQGYDPTSKTTPPTTTAWANVAGDNALYLYDDATYKLTSRIDIQLPNALMFGVYNSQGGVQLAPDTSDPFDTSNFPSSKYPYAFEVFGNNGTTPENGISTNANNHSLDDLTNTVPNATTVYYDLDELGSGSSFTGSDHYPIVGDYNVAPTTTTTTPWASFTASPTVGPVPLTVNFTDNSTGTITSVSWDFGDGGTTNFTAPTNVQHLYATSGVYTVILVAGGSAGASTNMQSNLITAMDPYAWWASNYFGCVTCPQAQGDSDPYGKGISNTNQFLLGLNPTNSASVFRILSVVQQTTDVVITWAAGGGRTNAVQATSGDANGGYTNNFVDITTPPHIIIPGSGDVTTNYTDIGAATNTPARYYRIRLGP